MNQLNTAITQGTDAEGTQISLVDDLRNANGDSVQGTTNVINRTDTFINTDNMSNAVEVINHDAAHQNGQGEFAADVIGKTGNSAFNLGKWANSEAIAEERTTITPKPITATNDAKAQQEQLTNDKEKLKAQQDAGDAFEDGCYKDSGIGCRTQKDYDDQFSQPNPAAQLFWETMYSVVPVGGLFQVVTKGTGKIVGVFRTKKLANEAAEEAAQKARVTNNNQIDDNLGNKPLGGEHRANQYSNKWQGASLRNVREKFAGENPIITQTSKGKIIHENRETGIQVVYDKGGDYFRIYDKSLPGRKYLDLNGKVLNNKTLPNGKQAGMSKSEYNEATHFKVDR